MLIILREDNLFSHMDKKSKRETLRVLDLHNRERTNSEREEVLDQLLLSKWKFF